ncbi:MAG: hypothetical protein ACI350_07565 [Prevotella sp.]
MKKSIFYTVLSASLIAVCSIYSPCRAFCPGPPATQQPDTIPLGHFEDERSKDTLLITRRNHARKTDSLYALDYVLDKRYHYTGETFRKRWSDHLFIETGGGFCQISSPSEAYRLTALTLGHIGVGKQFNKYHTARLTLNGGWGYLRSKDILLTKLGADLDYMFNLSSYFSGYNPSRLVNLSAVMGIGAQYANMSMLEQSGTAFNMHAGIQAKFYTGPHGYFSIEPYFGIGTDNTDLCQNRNWQKTDMFWGGKFSYIYYFNNNLSRESRKRIVRNKGAKDQLVNDSTLLSWQKPWLVEFSHGINVTRTPHLSITETMGPETTLSAGKWFSPVVGLRVSGSVRSTTWLKETEPGDAGQYRPDYAVSRKNIYSGLRLEAMFNPFGFSRDFSWSNRFGLFAVGGGELGWIIKDGAERLSCYSTSYTLGLNLWMRMADGLQLFAEPRYAYSEYKIPYTNRVANKVFSDDYFTLNIGLRFTNIRKQGKQATESDATPLYTYSAGIGGGFNMLLTQKDYNSGKPFNYNGRLFAEYRFDNVSGIHAAFEYVSFANTDKTAFWDCNLEYPHDDYLRTQRNGLMTHRYDYAFISANYLCNLSALLFGSSTERLIEMEAYAGPTYAFQIKATSTLDSRERLQENHAAVPVDAIQSKSMPCFNIGFKLKANLLKRISFWFSPTFYWLGTDDITGIDLPNIKYIETFNAGAQINF